MPARLDWRAVGAAAAGAQPAAPAAPQPATSANQAATICGQPVPPPRTLPPDGRARSCTSSPRVSRRRGTRRWSDVQTYLYYIQTEIQPAVRERLGALQRRGRAADSRRLQARLWATNFLDNLSIETQDYTFSNGVVGKLITYNLEERQRVQATSSTSVRRPSNGRRSKTSSRKRTRPFASTPSSIPV